MRIAIDFDGTIVEHNFPKIGAPIPYAVEVIKELKNEGHELILWTYRAGKALEEAVAYCEKSGLDFYAINENHPNEAYDFSIKNRKITADLYIDDRNLGGLKEWPEIYKDITGKEKTFESRKRKGWFKR